MATGSSGMAIAIVHPHFWWGGGEAVGLWSAQVLSESYTITILTFDDVNLKDLDGFYGTSLQSKNVSVCVLPLPRFLARSKSGFTMLRQYYMMYWCKRLRQQFSLFISTYNEMDFGGRGIQYIHFPLMAGVRVAKVGDPDFPGTWRHRFFPVRWLYNAAGRLLSRYNPKRMRENVTLVNSDWTGGIVQKVYSISTTTVYPPVACHWNCGIMEFTERENGFVTVGRLEPAKKIMEIIEILGAVRQAGFDVHLHVVGKKCDELYYGRLRAIQESNVSWITLEEGINRTALLGLLSSHRYGIHGRVNEHFGIAVAEMVKMGCIVFVPDSGGQVEVVGGNPALVYSSQEEAVEKIIAVLRDTKLQRDLHLEARRRGELFSVERFMGEIKGVCDGVLTGGVPPA